MNSWQKILVGAMALGGGIATQILIKDPDARATVTGMCGTLLGWMMRSPGDAPPPPKAGS